MKQGLQTTIVGLKREVVLLACEKELENLYHTTDVHLVGIHYLKGLPKGAC